MPSSLAEKLNRLLIDHEEKRIVVVGTTCTGKSTLLPSIPNAFDMDDLLFPQLSKSETDYVCQTPWTEEIGRTMVCLAKERVKVKPGSPVFGTVILDCDLVICLVISDELLRERCAHRKVSFRDAKNMQKQLENEIENSGLATIDFSVG